ncbi:MAG TPA: hypothetical protein VFF33_07780 [Ignavibacteriaceae bacterium]|nr:hypothetical protein [Ignavibacteriaceae bacterium]
MPFYNDDGTEVNPNELEIPEKCIKCKLHKQVNIAEEQKLPSVKWETNVFCILRRMNQMEEIKEFFCRDYILDPAWELKIN